MTKSDTWGRGSLDDFRHQSLSETVSTNTECFQHARAGDPGKLWITADRQTGGRGRRGRAWASEPGNLYSSLLLIDPAPAAKLGSLPLVVAVAVHKAISAVMPYKAAPVEIKWPNDIMIGRKKTCGILIESEALADGRHAVVIGIGTNIAYMPEHPLYPVTCLQREGSPAAPEELFAHLFATMAEALDIWNAGKGTRQIVETWREAACGIGEKITVNLPDRSLLGRFAGIDDNGLLMLEGVDGKVTPIAAGDVFLV